MKNNECNYVLRDIMDWLKCTQSMVAALLSVTEPRLVMASGEIDFNDRVHNRLARLWYFIHKANMMELENVFNLLHEPLDQDGKTILYYIVDMPATPANDGLFARKVNVLINRSIPTPEV